MKVLLVGAGPMAIDYAKVLAALNIDFDVVGRGEASAKKFTEATGKLVLLEDIKQIVVKHDYTHAIVAVGMEQLATIAIQLLQNGCKKILLEKPGGLNANEIFGVATLAKEKRADVLLAYNRRFYTSVFEAERIIEEDGGLQSINFEFTEWSHVIEPLKKADGVKENWFLGNSTHVVDLAFYFAGIPQQISCYKAGELSWHRAGSMFVGAGITQQNVLFNYNANWAAPGRWGVELLTNKHRIILKPLEKISVQKTGSVAIYEVPINDLLDLEFKPGLYLQTKTFLENNYTRFITIDKQAELANGIYRKITS